MKKPIDELVPCDALFFALGSQRRAEATIAEPAGMQSQSEGLECSLVVGERAATLLEILDRRDADVGMRGELATGPFDVVAPVVELLAERYSLT